MPGFICPVCSQPLAADGKTMKCAGGHSYDISKYGYVNLLMSNQSSLRRHGDDLMMVRARQGFLEKGYYNCLLEKLCESAVRYSPAAPDVLDAGCGECWYTEMIRRALVKAGKLPDVAAVDISKDALRVASSRSRMIHTAVASTSKLPVADDSCDVVINLFAPCSAAEFSRVLRQGGVLIRAVPLERHLYGLKAAIYESPYENSASDPALTGFGILENISVKGDISIQSREDILNLFKMTPYYYKTGADDQKKLNMLSHLETEIEFGVLVYAKAANNK